jgi:adenylate cyclase
VSKWARSIIIGLCTAVLGAVLIWADADRDIKLGFERDMGLPWLFHFRGALPEPPEVAVIGLNGDSGKLLGLPALPRDWPRSVHGRVLDELVRQDVAAVVFDYDFSLPKDQADDRKFGDSIAAANRVVLLQKLIGKTQTVYGSNGQAKDFWSEEAKMPVEPLASGARGMGPFVLPKVDQAAHQFWTFKNSAGDAPTTSAVAMQLAALRWHGEWLDILGRAGMAGVNRLPTRAEDIKGYREMRTLMGGLRQAFTQDGSLRGRVRDVLDSSYGQTLPEQARKMARALASLYAGADNRYLNFYGPPGTVKTFAYEAILPSALDPNAPRPEPGELAGRVVFLGYSDLNLVDQPDRYYTVFTNENGVDLSGVEIMATALANLLNDRTIEPAGSWTAAAIVLVFGFLIGFLIYALPALIAVPLTFVLTGLYAAGAQLLFNESALWLPWATPLMVQMPFALLVGLIAQYLLERRKVQSIAEALELYVPESVVRDLTGEGVDPDSVNQVVYGTCLANDMSGFSTISEGKSPKELARFMNAYFDAMAQPLKRNGVDVTEFHADTIMCAWTRDQESPEARRQVIVGAIGVLDAMDEFNEVEQVSLSARIGLQDGNFYLGHTGGGGRMAYSILGDPANTASRLEGLNKFTRTQILAAATVVDGVDGVLMRPVGSFQLVGKAEGLPACEIFATMDKATPEQQELCESFPAALEAFQDRRWDDAKGLFEAVLKRHPDDGPTAMYLDLLAQYAEHGLPEGDPTVIRMTSK